MRTFKITVDEDELKALIDHHTAIHNLHGYKVETSERIHKLTKSLNKPETEEPPQVTAAKTEQPQGW